MSERISDQEREAWQAACDAATPGPWRLTWDSQELRLHPAGVWEPAIAEWGYAVSPWRPETYDEVDRRDADFMVIAREALPRLLAENAALRAQVLPPPGPYDSAHETPIALWDGTRWLTELPTRLAATQPPLPDPPDPTAPQQLGLGGKPFNEGSAI